MTFGARLAQLRRERGLTQEALGKGLGTDGTDVGKSVVYGWEKDQHHPRVDQLALVCKALGCSADYLLWGKAAQWPFAIAFERFDVLDDKQKGYIEGRLASAIEECESAQMIDADQVLERHQRKRPAAPAAKRRHT